MLECCFGVFLHYFMNFLLALMQYFVNLLYIFCQQGRSLSALGRKEEAILVWKNGYEHAMHQCADLKQLVELEELLMVGKQHRSVTHGNHVTDHGSSAPLSKTGLSVDGLTSENSGNHDTSDIPKSFTRQKDASDICSSCSDNFGMNNGINDKARAKPTTAVPESRNYVNGKAGELFQNHNDMSNESEIHHELENASEICGKSGSNLNPCNGLRNKPKVKKKHDSQVNGIHENHGKLIYDSKSVNDLTLVSQSCSKSSTSCNPSDSAEISSKFNSNNLDVRSDISNETKSNKKFTVTRISKSRSISVDFRLSRGIAQVRF